MMQRLAILLCSVVLWVEFTQALDNGLALTPPMGFMTWQRYRCITDCQKYPDECISDRLIRRIADKMVSDGYLEAGYQYVIIDDCWMAKERDRHGRLQPDKDRFPHGMKVVSDYVHQKGLKFGIYEDYGNATCKGYPGSLGHLKADADLFAEWGVDYVKIDACNTVPLSELEEGYIEFGWYLNKTNRPMVYSCSWPAYFQEASFPLNYHALKKHCNLWRNYDDIQDSYSSLSDIMDWFATVQDSIVPHAGPGHWNDPDMLLVGNFGLSYDQALVQMAVWAILAAPLLMSVDLYAIRPEFREILLHKELISINQDPLGMQGMRVLKGKKEKLEVWKRKLKPENGHSEVYALVIVSKNDDGAPLPYNLTMESIGLTNPNGYFYRDVLKHGKTQLTQVGSRPFISIRVNPLGCVILKLYGDLGAEPHRNRRRQ